MASQGRGDHRCGGRGDPVGGEDRVVGGEVAGQGVDELAPDQGRELTAGDGTVTKRVGVRRVDGVEVDQLVGQLVVVLQGVHQ